MDNRETTVVGMPLGLITMVVLIVLKATGNLASMGWFLVISSIIWAPIAFIITIVFITTVVMILISLLRGDF